MESLILDLIEWLGVRERSYEETMNAWRTSCPRLPVWEDAVDRGFVGTNQRVVWVTDAGRRFLMDRRPAAAAKTT